MRRIWNHASVALAVLFLSAPGRAADDPVALMEAGHYKQSRPLVESLERANPDDPRALYLEARLALAKGDAASALPLAERAATGDPKNADYRYLVAQCVGTQAQHAGPLKGLGLAKRFLKETRAALAIDPRNLDAREGLIEFYSVAPGIAGGNDKMAAAMAETLVTLDPVRGRLAQATLATRDKQDAKAEAALQQALAAGDGYRTRIALARWCVGENHLKMDLAEQHAKAARAAEPGRVGGHVMLAYVYAHEQRWTDLDQALAEAERAVPDNLTPCYQVGRTLVADSHDPARAERALRKYLGQEPEYGSPSLAAAHWRLGLAIEQQGRKPEALAEVQKALDLDPSLDGAKKDLKRLKRD